MRKTIICVRQGDKYTADDVNALMRQCRVAEPNARFICLSDSTDHEAETIILQAGLDGWWAKIELFSTWMEQFRPYLYLDLDTFVLSGFGDMWTKCGDEFWMLSDFYYPNRGQSAMMWIPKDTRAIWNKWLEKPKQFWYNKYRSDQNFLETFPFLRIQDCFYGHMSYKADELQDGPAEAVTVHFHGKPKPKDCKGWALEHWSAYV